MSSVESNRAEAASAAGLLRRLSVLTVGVLCATTAVASDLDGEQVVRTVSGERVELSEGQLVVSCVSLDEPESLAQLEELVLREQQGAEVLVIVSGDAGQRAAIRPALARWDARHLPVVLDFRGDLSGTWDIDPGQSLVVDRGHVVWRGQSARWAPTYDSTTPSETLLLARAE